MLFNNLFDIYEKALTDNQRDLFSLYYKENLSMQEIADEKTVSKAFVGKVIKEVEKKLTQLEEEYQLLKIKEDLTKLLDENDLEIIKERIGMIINHI